MLNIVLDSFAIIAYLRGEPGAQTVQNLLAEAEEGRVQLFLHRINWGEIYYQAYRENKKLGAEKVVNAIEKLPLVIIDECGEKFAKNAALLKGKHPVAYADAFAIQLSIDKDAQLVTGDPEIKRISAAEKLKLVWLGEK